MFRLAPMSTAFIRAFVVGHGRITRGTWLFRIAVLALACTAFGMLAQSFAGSQGASLFALLFLWSAGALSVKRLHDTGRSGWALLALSVPVLGPLWLLLQLSRRSVEGSNRYGSDPVARMDYLKVDIAK